jgi:hypothetical protein
VKQALPKLLPGMILTAAVAGSTLAVAVSSRRLSFDIINSMIVYLIVIGPWTILYYGYHYMRKTRTEDLQRRRLGLLLKERQELGPVVDIDFITDSLNHIKSTIDQDPEASRQEITAFSQLLRNGYLKHK